MQSTRSIPLLVSEISIIKLSQLGSLKDHLSDQDAYSTQGEVSGDGMASTRQGVRLETVQKMDGGHLRGRPSSSGQTVGPDTCGRRK